MPKGLALLSFVVALHTLVSQVLHMLPRTLSFCAFLEKGFFELVQHNLEVFHLLKAELGHMLLELSFLKVNLLLRFNDALS